MNGMDYDTYRELVGESEKDYEQEDTAVYHCENCGKGIYNDDYYYEVEDIILCENCIKERRIIA